MKTKVTLSLTALICVGLLILPGCKNKSEVSTTETETVVSTGQEPPIDPKAGVSEFTSLGNYQFKLAPEIEKDGATHLDLYIQDAKGVHVPGATALVHLTATDGHQLTVKLAEDRDAKHYGAKTTLEDLGEYQAVAQVTVNGKKLNPRFTFSRAE